MHYSLTEDEQQVVLALNGHLDTTCVGELSEKYDLLAERIKTKKLVIDCEKLEYVSSSGLRLLLRLCKESKTRITLKSVNNSVLQVLTITRLANCFDIEL